MDTMFRLMGATLLHTLKIIYSVVIAIGAIVGVIVAFWGFLDLTGITEGQAKSMVDIPGELKQTIELGNQALQKYLDAK